MKGVKMETIVASVVGALVMALITLWLPEANEKAAEAGIPIRCELVQDAGSHPDTSVDAPVEVTNAQD